MNPNIIIISVFILYFGCIIAMAYRFRKSKNLSDYYLGGRKLNSWLGGLSAQTSDMSGWMLMGLPGAIFILGAGYIWIAIGLTAGIVINWLFVAKRLRRYTIIADNSVTLPQYLTNRFHDKKNVLSFTAAIIFAVFFTVYVAASLVAGGTLLNTLFGLNYQVGVAVIALIIIAYTVLGGLLAISWTDSIQGTMMLLAAIILPFIAISFAGGWDVIASNIDQPGFFNLMSDTQGNQLSAVTLISNLAWGLGYFGMPHVLIKLIAIRSDEDVSKAAIIGITWVLIALTGAVLVGMVGRGYFAPELMVNPGTNPDVTNPFVFATYPYYGFAQETVFIQIISRIFIDNGTFFTILIGGIFLCGIFAAIKSTADSQMLVASSAITNDIYKNISKSAGDKKLLVVSRLTIVAVAFLAFLFALNPGAGVMALVAHAWAGFGSAFGPLIILSIYWSRVNFQGAFAGMIAGGTVVLVWNYIPLMDGLTLLQYTSLFSLVPGFIISFISILVVSLATKAPDSKIIEEFTKASQPLSQ